jgi:hypothetical protein
VPEIAKVGESRKGSHCCSEIRNRIKKKSFKIRNKPKIPTIISYGSEKLFAL